MTNVAFLDLDGCISDDRWRMHLIRPFEANPELRYREYHSASNHDVLARDNFQLVRSHIRGDNAPVNSRLIIASARPERYREKTVKWLNLYGIFPLAVLLRPDHNRESAVLVKARMLGNVRSIGRLSVHWAFDDREDICNMYTQLGVPSVTQLKV